MKIVVFAGGVGTRLWPLSRKSTPKQFHKIFGDESSLQETIKRLLPKFHPSDIYIATGKNYQNLVREQLWQIPYKNFIFEPEMRDVGPAIGLTTTLLDKQFRQEPMAILWSDHLVKKTDTFIDALLAADDLIKKKKGNFVFVAQPPRFANQNMGWIELGKKIKSLRNGVSLYSFGQLRYRPNLQEAESFFKDKNFVWNLGYFVTTPKYLMLLFKTHKQSMYRTLLEIQNAWGKKHFNKTLNKLYPKLEKISFDDAILTNLRGDKTLVLSADLGWSDVGAWESLKEALSNTQKENVSRGKVLLTDSEDSLAFNFTKQLVVGIDLNEMLVIATEDVVLVCQKKSVPKIKKLVESLENSPHAHLT